MSVKPSEQDQKVAYKMQIPNYVVSHDGVWVAQPIGEEVTLAKLYSYEELERMIKKLTLATCPKFKPMLWLHERGEI